VSTTNLQSLFQKSQQSGMSNRSVDILVQNLSGQAGLGCVGAQVDDLNTDESTLVLVVMDSSGSMSSLRDDVIDAFNQMTRALKDSKQSDSILLSAWTFDSTPHLLFGYSLIDQVPDLNRTTYAPNGSTALYDAVLDGFTGLVAYNQTLRDAGNQTRCVVVVISDGDDNTSQRTAAAVKTVATDLLKQEIYTLAFIGMGDARTFQQVAGSMGFPSILTVANSASDIRKALALVSNSVIRVSQQTGKASAGNGFFTP